MACLFLGGPLDGRVKETLLPPAPYYHAEAGSRHEYLPQGIEDGQERVTRIVYVATASGRSAVALLQDGYARMSERLRALERPFS